jgi:hypothetical protein
MPKKISDGYRVKIVSIEKLSNAGKLAARLQIDPDGLYSASTDQKSTRQNFTSSFFLSWKCPVD